MPNWKEVNEQIKQFTAVHAHLSNSAVDHVRREYLTKLHQHTNRNVIAYYSGWLSKPDLTFAGITDSDKNGFMMAVHQLDKSLGLDLILHTPGGDIAATQSIVFFLRQLFGRDIRAFVPQIAMSAGTMMACSCKEIWMGKHSSIGPIDPHLMSLPALGVKKEFERAYQEIKADPDKAQVWGPILQKYPPTFLSQCENAVLWSMDFVQEQLEECMLFDKKGKKKRAASIVKYLSDYDENKTHSKHIHYDEAKKIKLVIKELESDDALQDLVLTVHHCFMHALSNTNAYKMIENHNGAAMVQNVNSQ